MRRPWSAARAGSAGLVVLLLPACGAPDRDSRTPPDDTAVAPPASGDWQLFVDDWLVAERTGVERRYHAFEKHPDNPVLVGDQPWENGRVYVYGTAMAGEGGEGYRLWYHALPLTSFAQYALLYAESEDGLHWTKPALGIVDYEGSTANNLFLRREGYDHIPTVLRTPQDDDEGCGWRLMNFDAGTLDGFCGACSDDGLHWRDVPGNPLISGAGDVGNFLWDEPAGLYRGTIKVASYDERGLKRRAVGYSETADFLDWPEPALVLAPDAWDDRWAPEGSQQRTHFYGLGAFRYESLYLGFLWVFRATDDGGYDDGTIFVELVSSRDGVTWEREEGDRPPLLALGEAGTWDDGMVLTTQAPVVQESHLDLFYGGCDGTHGGPAEAWTCSIGLASLRRGGFASLDAGDEEGVVLTHPLRAVAGSLRLNYNANGGSIRVAVLDGEGGALPGYALEDCTALTGDSVDEAVRWAGGDALPTDAGDIALRFVLRDAALYGFRAGSFERVPR